MHLRPFSKERSIPNTATNSTVQKSLKRSVQPQVGSPRSAQSGVRQSESPRSVAVRQESVVIEDDGRRG